MSPIGPAPEAPVRARADLRVLLAVQRATSKPVLVREARLLGAHATSVALKRVSLGPRPQYCDLLVHASVGRWSFLSSHVALTTAAALLFARLTGRPVFSALVPVMAASGMTLCVHTPSDVLAGMAVGAAAAGAHARWNWQAAS